MPPDDVRTQFDTVARESPAPNLRFKAIRRGGVQQRLLEFSRGFVEHDWCTKKHVGFVLAGELALEMPEGSARLPAGDSIALPGEEAKHKASALTDTVTLFLVEDARTVLAEFRCRTPATPPDLAARRLPPRGDETLDPARRGLYGATPQRDRPITARDRAGNLAGRHGRHSNP